MSEENVEVVRQPVALRAESRRHLDERLGLRFPRAMALYGRAVLRLPPRSRLRQALIRRAVKLCFEAINREDHEAAVMLYHPDGESIYPAQFSTVGAESRTRGREERLRFQNEWRTEWGDWQAELEEVIDVGDRVLVLGHFKGSGVSSGAGLNTECAFLFTLSDGQVIHEQVFLAHQEALESAGLSE